MKQKDGTKDINRNGTIEETKTASAKFRKTTISTKNL